MKKLCEWCGDELESKNDHPICQWKRQEEARKLR